MANAKYYDGTKLLSLSDINGEKPAIYICTSNRSAGKTTYFNRLAVNKFKKENEKFCLMYRFKYELAEVSDKFFKDIKSLFFPDDDLTSESAGMGAYYNLYLNGKHCGYAVSLNSADQIKKYSHLLSDIQRIIFDEFQSETNSYCQNEVAKFISIYKSIARGHGEQSRYVPVYMISNPVSVLNPYYVEMGITQRLTNDVNFLRGNGWVLEQGHSEAAEEAQNNSAFAKAFQNNDYIKYSASGNYLLDNNAFIEKISGKSRYLCTLKYANKEYAIREYSEQGILYCDDTVDPKFPFKISVDTNDHQINYVMLQRSNYIIQSMRNIFEKGRFRFKNIQCKEVIIKMLCYH